MKRFSFLSLLPLLSLLAFPNQLQARALRGGLYVPSDARLHELGFSSVRSAPGSDTPAKFRAAAAAIPRRLLQLGNQSYGPDFDLRAFADNLGPVKVTFGVVHGTRERLCRASAYWQTHPEKTIHVDRAAWVRMADVQEVLALHEFLGVEGYNDDEMWISAPLWLLANPKATQYLSTEQVQAIERWVKEKAVIAADNIVGMGGVTGVGGGGEGATVRAKIIPIIYAIDKLASADADADDKKEAWDDIDHSLTGHEEAFRDLNCLEH